MATLCVPLDLLALAHVFCLGHLVRVAVVVFSASLSLLVLSCLSVSSSVVVVVVSVASFICCFLLFEVVFDCYFQGLLMVCMLFIGLFKGCYGRLIVF